MKRFIVGVVNPELSCTGGYRLAQRPGLPVEAGSLRDRGRIGNITALGV